MRCPHCGSPVPLGSSICIDCGAKLNVKEWNPWDEKEHTTARKNTGEREYKLNNIRQQMHEQAHTAHSNSKEAERSYESQPHARPTAARPTTRKATAKARPKKKSKGWIIVVLFFLIGLIGDGCESVLSNLDVNKDEILSGIESFLDDSEDYDSDSYVPEGETTYYDDGSYDEVWYNENDEVSILQHNDADGYLIYEEDYTDGVLQYRYESIEDGYRAMYYDENGALSDASTYTFYDDGTEKSEAYESSSGVVYYESYYDEGGDCIGEVIRDEDTGEVTNSWGIDLNGNDLEVMYPTAE